MSRSLWTIVVLINGLTVTAAEPASKTQTRAESELPVWTEIGDWPAPKDLPKQAALPDALTMFDGTPVKTAEDWRLKRRPELKQLFQHYVYGYLPPAGQIETRVVREVPDLLDGKATLREVEIRLPWLRCAQPPVIHVALFIPNGRTGKLPVFLGINRRGTHSVLEDDRITPTPDPTDPKQPDVRGSGKEFWCVEQILDRGYIFATFHQDDIDPDKHDFTDGLHSCLDMSGLPAGVRPGTIAAWAWGMHRIVDYLVTDPAVDSRKIALIGHSRRGKTVLFAAAMDERIALVVPHQSGTGGMALSRNNDQESVARINKNFPHWFNDNFTDFDNNESQLPVDQHLLVALMAPRPLLDTAGLKDTWANYESALKNLKAADPVYELLGRRGLVGDGMLNEADAVPSESAGELLQFRLNTPHELNCAYWTAILNFADVQFAK